MLDKNAFETHIETTPDIQAYLERIGLKKAPALTLDGLNELILAHQMSVPFENIGICDHAYHVSLKVNDLFEKIINKRRGGYCFENNASFASLLNGLGFTVRPCACRMTGAGGRITRIIHRANIVTIDGKEYLCDVSSGGTEAPVAIEIKEDVITRCEKEEFYFQRFDENWWEFHVVSPYLDPNEAISEPKDNMAILLSTAKVLPEDFYAVSDYCCTDPFSPFVVSRRVYLRTDKGFVKLMGNKLSIVENDTATVKTVAEEDIPCVLKEYFGLVY